MRAILGTWAGGLRRVGLSDCPHPTPTLAAFRKASLLDRRSQVFKCPSSTLARGSRLERWNQPLSREFCSGSVSDPSNSYKAQSPSSLSTKTGRPKFNQYRNELAGTLQPSRVPFESSTVLSCCRWWGSRQAPMHLCKAMDTGMNA